jgi:hypothetical protein
MAATATAQRALLTTREAAEYLARKPQTLTNWRCQRIGPKYTGAGKGIRYRQSDLDAWLDANTH